MMCFLSAFKMKKNQNIKCIITVPQTIIASGFLEEKLHMPDGENINWKIGHNLCDKKLSQGTVNYIINWLSKLNYESHDDRILICTHATITKAYQKLENLGRLDLLSNLILWVDEAHHIKNINVKNEDIIIGNALGNLVRNLIAKQDDNVEVGLTTASFFRGDRGTLITPSMEQSFKRYNLPYDDYLKTMAHLKSFSFDFLLCDYDYTQAIEILAKERTGKDIIYIPHPTSQYSTRNKLQEISDMIGKYQNVHGGVVELQNDLGIIALSGTHKNFKILDLVDDKDRDKKKEYISNKALKDDSESLDIIFALGMFKEGANWIWADRSIIVGIRNSLVDVVQMVGRLFRDAPGKEHVEVIQLLPFTMNQQDKKIEENLNNYLKAIFASLILEDILEPIKINHPVKKESLQSDYVESIPNQFNQLVPDETTRQLLVSEVTKHIFEVASNSNKNDIDSYYDEYQEGIPEIVEQFGITNKDEATAIGEHVWKMWLRRKYKTFNGINIKDIDINLLKNMDPREGLLGYTSGPCGHNTFEDVRRAIQKSYNWCSFEEAREFARSLKFKTQNDWFQYVKTNEKPQDIPACPNEAYRVKGWVSWGDFLGTGRIASQNYKCKSFEEAREFVRTLGFKNNKEWRAWSKSDARLHDIPTGPDKRYKDEGWISWGYFLGNNNIGSTQREFRKFDEAKTFVRNVGFASRIEWEKWLNSDERPIDIPSNPSKAYKNEWNGWGDFLGTGVVAHTKKQFKPFVEARIFARQLSLKSKNEWDEWTKQGTRPADIPTEPSRTYKNKGWLNWKDWLGTSK